MLLQFTELLQPIKKSHDAFISYEKNSNKYELLLRNVDGVKHVLRNYNDKDALQNLINFLEKNAMFKDSKNGHYNFKDFEVKVILMSKDL